MWIHPDKSKVPMSDSCWGAWPASERAKARPVLFSGGRPFPQAPAAAAPLLPGRSPQLAGQDEVGERQSRREGPSERGPVEPEPLEIFREEYALTARRL